MTTADEMLFLGAFLVEAIEERKLVGRMLSLDTTLTVAELGLDPRYWELFAKASIRLNLRPQEVLREMVVRSQSPAFRVDLAMCRLEIMAQCIDATKATTRK